MKLSVIIPTRNRAQLLDRALTSLRDQTLDPDAFEVIVVDNGSTDDIRAVCGRHNNHLNHLRYILEPRPGLHEGRHAGMRSASANLLVYCDDDIRAVSTWLEAVLEGFADPTVGLVGGRVLPDYEVPPPRWIEDLELTIPAGSTLPEFSLIDCGDSERDIDPTFVYGCNFGIRKRLLESVGGFHPDGMPPELIRFRGDGETFVSRAVEALGLTARYHPKAVVRHFVSRSRMSDNYLYHRSYAQGISDSYTQIRSVGGVTRSQLIKLRTQQWRSRIRSMPGRLHRSDRIRNLKERGYSSGFWYHHRETFRDPDLLRWVLRTSYLEAQQ